MRQATFHEDAGAELAEAARYYENRGAGLGQALLDDVEQAVQEIVENPLANALISTELRSKRIRRFPYSVLYAIDPDGIRIIAVAHQKRRPEYWRHRISLI